MTITTKTSTSLVVLWSGSHFLSTLSLSQEFFCSSSSYYTQKCPCMCQNHFLERCSSRPYVSKPSSWGDFVDIAIPSSSNICISCYPWRSVSYPVIHHRECWGRWSPPLPRRRRGRKTRRTRRRVISRCYLAFRCFSSWWNYCIIEPPSPANVRRRQPNLYILINKIAHQRQFFSMRLRNVFIMIS